MYGDDYKTRDGTGDRDYVHVMDLAEGHVKVRHHQHHAANDHCQAVDHILGAGKEGVHIFNLGTGTGATVLEVVVNSINTTISWFSMSHFRSGTVLEVLSYPH